jgi:hypothetical protein
LNAGLVSCEGAPIADYDRLLMAAAAGWIARIITVLRSPAGKIQLSRSDTWVDIFAWAR